MTRGVALLDVRGLRTQFVTGAGTVTAVDGVSLRVDHGEIVGMVGESGSGKSVTSRSILQVLPPEGRIVAGEVLFEGTDMLSASERELSAWRGRRVGMIFQEAAAALNPVLTVGEQIVEGARRHLGLSRRDARERATELLVSVGISEAERRFGSYPHELSGGMQQRCMIAMVLACEPDMLIADEPTTALDVTVQAQILDLLVEIVAEREVGLLFITHNIAAVAQIADRIVVMYAGRVVEEGTTAEVIDKPKHPYTKALLSAMPSMSAERGKPLDEIRGSVPDLAHIPPGCTFHPRCEVAMSRCSVEQPLLLPVANGDTDCVVRCLLYQQ